jgi:multimeric flavodoxin WrbA
MCLALAAIEKSEEFSDLDVKLAKLEARAVLFGTPVHKGILSVPTRAFFDQVTYGVLSGKVDGTSGSRCGT